MKKFEFFFSLLMAILVPVLGTILMYGIAYMIPMKEDSPGNYILYACIFLAFLLVIPYVMLKFIFHMSHMKNAKEDEFHLLDIPKEQEKNVTKEEVIDIKEEIRIERKE